MESASIGIPIASAQLAVDEEAAPGHKGLKDGAIGQLSGIVIGVASTAPAYSLAATLGLLTAVLGFGAPAALVVAFIPMILIAVAFYYLNRADPDCGTTFTWVTKAMGPHVGWMGGWTLIVADVVVMASLAQIAGSYTEQLFGGSGSTVWSTTLIGVAWIALMTLIVYVGIEVSARTQWLLLAAEYLILIAFSIVALAKVYGGSPPAHSTHVHASWLSPFANHGGVSALAVGVLLAVFIYWGWDTAVNVNEETKDRERAPGMAALWSVVVLLFIYVLVSVAANAYAGPTALSNHSNDALSFLSNGVFGSGFGKLLIIAVLTSAAASTQTTILPTARVTLSMAAFKAAPKAFARIHPRFKTPAFSTVVMGVASTTFFVLLILVDHVFQKGGSVLKDTISALGLQIAVYYGLTGVAAAIYYRRTLLSSVRHFLLAGVAPFLGGLMLLALFGYDAYKLNNTNPNSAVSSSKMWFGIGSLDVLGVGLILVGFVFMGWWWYKHPGFFRRRPESYPPPPPKATVPPAPRATGIPTAGATG